MYERENGDARTRKVALMLCSGGARTQPNELQDSSSAFSADPPNDASAPRSIPSLCATRLKEAMKQPTDETVGLGRRVGGWKDGGMEGCSRSQA